MALKRVYSWILALLPLLSMYKGLGNKLDLGTVLVGILFTLILLIDIEKRKCVVDIFWCIYVLYIVLSILIPVFNGNFVNEVFYVLLRLGKNLCYILIFVVSYGTQLYEHQIFIKAYKVISITASAFLYFQVFCATFLNRLVVGYISGLVNHDSYVEDISRTTAERFRASSFFYEPGHYFAYVALAIILYLFSKRIIERKDIILALFISGGIILSTSGAGILFVVLVWVGWFCWQLFLWIKRGRIKTFFVLLCVMIICAIPLVLKSPKIIYAMDRVFNLQAEGGNAVIGRLYGFGDILKMSFFNVFFGCGYANVGKNYYPTFASVLMYTGVIGLLMVLSIFYSIYRRLDQREMRVAFIGYLILCFYAEMFMSVNLLFCMVFFNKSKRNEIT